MPATKRNTIFSAVSSAIADRLSQRRTLSPVPDSVRIYGKVCMVTGANSGLGKAVAIDLAKRGGHVLMACRGGHPDAGQEVRMLSGSENVEMLKVDLADLGSVHALCDRLRRDQIRLDITVLNAGVMPRTARRSAQGYELMFAVHFLANRLLIDRLLTDGTIRPATRSGETPRIVFVVSEQHRSAGPIDFARFGAFTDYGLKDGLKHYGSSKLHLCTFAQELSRRLNPDGEVRVAVTSLCPGAVNSNLAREAPPFLKPLLHPIMRLSSRRRRRPRPLSPMRAAKGRWGGAAESTCTSCRRSSPPRWRWMRTPAQSCGRRARRCWQQMRVRRVPIPDPLGTRGSSELRKTEAAAAELHGAVLHHQPPPHLPESLFDLPDV